MYKYIITLFPFLLPIISIGQNNSNIEKDSLFVESIPTEFIKKMDFLYSTWYFEKNENKSTYKSDFINAKSLPDSIYLQRFDSLNPAIRLSFNSIVKNYIVSYLSPYTADRTARLAGLLEYYSPMIEQELDAACLPLELKYLPMIESAMNPIARSPVGATGLWQFMYPTAKHYGMRVTSFIDDRMDPVLSTKFAVRFLKDLYSIYEDWILAIAAYNCGPGNVNKAIRRSGTKKNYWDIYYALPKETRGYIPAFIAAIYVFNYYKEHGIEAEPPNMPTLRDTITITEPIHFEQIVENLDISKEELRDLNPIYRTDIIPAGNGRTFPLILPYNVIGDFIDKGDTIFAHNRNKYFNDSDRTADPEKRFKKYVKSRTHIGDKMRIKYKVKRGDVPGLIARKFKVTLADLRYWNNLDKRYTIKVGQKLNIYVSDKLAKKYKREVEYVGRKNNSAPKY